MTIMTDEEVEKISEIYDRVHTLGVLMGIRPDTDRFVDALGQPVGNTELDAIQQVIVRDWETVRVRDRIWHSDLPEDDKYHLILLLNTVTTYIDSIIKHEKDTVLIRESNRVKEVLNERTWGNGNPSTS